MTETVGDLIDEVEDDGWVYQYTRGSHHHFEHPTKRGKVTIAGRRSKDLHPATARDIRRQAQIKKKKKKKR